jgi:hypothetical protein
MHCAVRQLYKELLLASRAGYPQGMAEARAKLKAAFFARRDAPAAELPALFSRGQFVIREIQALGRLHKYRRVASSKCTSNSFSVGFIVSLAS